MSQRAAGKIITESDWVYAFETIQYGNRIRADSYKRVPVEESAHLN